MKTIFVFAALLLLPLSILAEEQITIETKLIEGISADIVHDMKILSQTKWIDTLTAPLMKTELGKVGEITLSGKDASQLKLVQPFSDISSGIRIRVIPHRENGKITFRGQIVIRKIVDHGNENFEIESRELYISGTHDVGGEAWFEFAEDSEGKKIAVWIRLSE